MRFGVNLSTLGRLLVYLLLVGAAAAVTEGINLATNSGLNPATLAVIVAVGGAVLKQIQHELNGHAPGNVIDLSQTVTKVPAGVANSAPPASR